VLKLNRQVVGLEVNGIMRIVKEADIRKSEILDTAERLFVSQGYENTSTTDILNAIGIARGTLYYHFKSKEDILSAVIDRQIAIMAEKAKSVAQNKEIPTLQRIFLAVSAIKVDSKLGEELTNQIHNPKNALMHQMTQEALLLNVNPIISGILKEAISEGLCSTDYPDEVIETIMVYASYAFDDLVDISESERQKKIDALIYNIERLLSIKKGSMREMILSLFDQ
jgi:AcrR family transcriptional regulator